MIGKSPWISKNVDTVLQTHNLGKHFGKRWAVRDLNLTVHRGEVFGFLGPNGAGKSTTIRMLLSLIAPTEGHVELFGKPLRRHRRDILSRVGGLVERPDFYLYLSARRNLQIVAALRDDDASRTIDEVLDTVGLTARADDKVKTYSHGMKQRLGIAQALLGRPEFVILDEPTSGLDPHGIKEVRELIQRLSAGQAMTVFLSSHLLHEIEQTATSMAIINQGRLVVQGSVKELLNSGDTVLAIDATPPERVRHLIEQQQYVKGVKSDERTVMATMPLEKAAELNALLVRAGCSVHALVPKRSLEEYFLSITEGATDVSPQRRGY
jgi:ABC-type multidrug transport system ATPase subunit